MGEILMHFQPGATSRLLHVKSTKDKKINEKTIRTRRNHVVYDVVATAFVQGTLNTIQKYFMVFCCAQRWRICRVVKRKKKYKINKRGCMLIVLTCLQ